ncbi:MAG: hypothetical protein WBJ50_06610, partial [Smithellaceae bacterium]
QGRNNGIFSVYFADSGRASFEKFESLPQPIHADMEKRHVGCFDADLGATFTEPDKHFFVF